MARVSQFVVFACIAIVSSYTFQLLKNSQYDLEGPPENQDLEIEKYDSYVDDLIAQLSPEEINILKSHHAIDVEDRDGNTGNCSYTVKKLLPRQAIDDDEIIILNSKINQFQTVDFQICNGQDNYSCKPTTNQYHYYGCCIQKTKKIVLYVMLKKDILNNKAFVDVASTGTENEKYLKKEVSLYSLCACEDYAETVDDLLNNIPKEEQCKYK